MKVNQSYSQLIIKVTHSKDINPKTFLSYNNNIMNRTLTYNLRDQLQFLCTFWGISFWKPDSVWSLSCTWQQMFRDESWSLSFIYSSLRTESSRSPHPTLSVFVTELDFFRSQLFPVHVSFFNNYTIIVRNNLNNGGL